MPETPDFDFIKAFVGVDVLQAQAVAKVIGNVIASLHAGMVEGGMNEGQAALLISRTFVDFMESMQRLYGQQQQ